MKPDKVPVELLRHPVEKYLECDPFLGDGEDMRLRKTEIVRRRTVTQCTMGLQSSGTIPDAEHPAGTVMWQESGIIDDGFGAEHVCLPHIAITIDFANGGNRDPYEFTCAEAAAYVPQPEED